MKRPASRRQVRFMAGASTSVLLLAAVVLAGSGSAAQPGSADLKITKAGSPDPVRIGTELTYSIGVENLGPSPATGVAVTDDLPKNVDVVSATGPSGSCTVQGGKVTCAFGALNPVGVNYGGTQVTATIVIVPRATGTIRNTATVKGDQKDPVNANNKAAVTTRVIGGASCRGIPATLNGTSGNDELLGTPGPDVIASFGGDDRILASAGQDLICAGRGNDYVGAGTAADKVFGAGGRDRLLGRGGPDLLKGAAGDDVLKGGRGSDRLRGGRGFDVCRGGPGADSIRGCERGSR
jgi:uncharacterized repeat protein (TIGR01451 family)